MFALVFVRSTFCPDGCAHYYNNRAIRPDLFAVHHELQQLGGWSNYEMVLRYAHLSSAHLRAAAERV